MQFPFVRTVLLILLSFVIFNSNGALADPSQETKELVHRIEIPWVFGESIGKGKAIELINKGADLTFKMNSGRNLFEVLILILSTDVVEVIDAVRMKYPEIDFQTQFKLNLNADMDPKVLQALLDNGANPDRCFPESDSVHCPLISDNSNFMQRESLNLILKHSAHMAASERVGYVDKRGVNLLSLLLSRIRNIGESYWLEVLENLVNRGMNIQKLLENYESNRTLKDSITSFFYGNLDAADFLLKNNVRFDGSILEYNAECLEKIVTHNLGYLAQWYFEKQSSFHVGPFSVGGETRSFEEHATLYGSSDVLEVILDSEHNSHLPNDKLLKLAIEYEQASSLDVLLKKRNPSEELQNDDLFDAVFRVHSLPSVNVLLKNKSQVPAFFGANPDFLKSLRRSARMGDFRTLSNFFSKASEIYPDNRTFLKTVCEQEVLPYYRQADEDSLKYTLKGWAEAFGSGISQKKYNLEFRKAIAETVEHLSTYYTDPITRFNDLLGYLGKRRNKIAIILNHDPLDEFGKLRTSTVDLFTPMAGIYEKFRKYLEENSSPYGKVVVTLEGSPIVLTEYGNYSNYGGSRYGWIHTSSWNLPVLKRKISHLLDEVLDSKYSLSSHSIHDSSELDEKISDLVWWLSQATFFYRGSAAITDILRNALYQYHGYDGGKWKQNVCSDCYALSTPSPEAFRPLYLSLKEPTQGSKSLVSASMCDSWITE